jgi:hypothetical protein
MQATQAIDSGLFVAPSLGPQSTAPADAVAVAIDVRASSSDDRTNVQKGRT